MMTLVPAAVVVMLFVITPGRIILRRFDAATASHEMCWAPVVGFVVRIITTWLITISIWVVAMR